MFRNRKVNSKINHFHESALKLVYNDNISPYKYSILSNRPIQSKNNISDRMISDGFENRNISYNTRSRMDFMQTSVKTSSFGINLLRYLLAYGILSHMILSQLKA